MWIIVTCVACSIITSVVTTKILATHYFKIVDGYVDEMCGKTREFVNSVLYKQNRMLFRKRSTEEALF